MPGAFPVCSVPVDSDLQAGAIPPPPGTPFLPKKYPVRYVRRRAGHRYYY